MWCAALKIGADDFLTKPANASELHARIKAGWRIIEMHRVLTEQNTVMTDTLAELRSVHAVIDQDLQQARKIQQALVPDWQRNFGAPRVSFLLQPCGHVGGDLVEVLNSDLDHLGVYCGDISGYSLPRR
jgi:sigma-B regulation protein RsbU (phosphoserine phosphatase)